jgi:sulfite reductase alpha subunit-like flavoprotein
MYDDGDDDDTSIDTSTHQNEVDAERSILWSCVPRILMTYYDHSVQKTFIKNSQDWVKTLNEEKLVHEQLVDSFIMKIALSTQNQETDSKIDSYYQQGYDAQLELDDINYNIITQTRYIAGLRVNERTNRTNQLLAGNVNRGPRVNQKITSDAKTAITQLNNYTMRQEHNRIQPPRNRVPRSGIENGGEGSEHYNQWKNKITNSLRNKRPATLAEQQQQQTASVESTSKQQTSPIQPTTTTATNGSHNEQKQPIERVV